LVHHFNVYVPDLVFFGDSFTTRSDRSDSFQAQCVYRVMEVNSVKRMRVVGLSYGGFVAYSLAAQFKEMVERVVICCAGVCLEEKDLEDGLFPVKSLEEAAEILLPQTPEKMKELMRFTFVKPPVKTPNCILVDFIQVILVIFHHFKLQPTKIIWGDKDQVFPLELGYRLKRHLGDNADMVVLKDMGHAYIAEKPKEFYKHLKSFLLPPVPPLPSSATTPTTASDTTTTTTTDNNHNHHHLHNNGRATVTT
ncbi:lipase 1, partial [Helianthus annuus]